jgi:hypothetical protein
MAMLFQGMRQGGVEVQIKEVYPQEASNFERFLDGYLHLTLLLLLHHSLVVRQVAATWQETSVPSSHNDPTHFYCFFSSRRIREVS